MKTISGINWRAVGPWAAFLGVVWPAQYGLILAVGMVSLPVVLALVALVGWFALRTARRHKAATAALVGGLFLKRAAEKMAPGTDGRETQAGPNLTRVDSRPRFRFDPSVIVRPVALDYLRGLAPMNATDRIVTAAIVSLWFAVIALTV